MKESKLHLPVSLLLLLLAASAAVAATPGAGSAACLASGDGYLRARVAGAIDASIDWPNSGTKCEGEAKSHPPGVRMSFQRASGSRPNLLFLFGLTGIRKGLAAVRTASSARSATRAAPSTR